MLPDPESYARAVSDALGYTGGPHADAITVAVARAFAFYDTHPNRAVTYADPRGDSDSYADHHGDADPHTLRLRSRVRPGRVDPQRRRGMRTRPDADGDTKPHGYSPI